MCSPDWLVHSQTPSCSVGCPCPGWSLSKYTLLRYFFENATKSCLKFLDWARFLGRVRIPDLATLFVISWGSSFEIRQFVISRFHLRVIALVLHQQGRRLQKSCVTSAVLEWCKSREFNENIWPMCNKVGFFGSLQLSLQSIHLHRRVRYCTAKHPVWIWILIYYLFLIKVWQKKRFLGRRDNLI